MFPPITYGDSPAGLVLFHGGPGMPGNISILGEHLTKTSYSSLQVVQNTTSIKSLLKSIHAQIEAGGKEKVVLIGHSFGAWIAGVYAAHYPEKIRKTILIGCGPLSDKYVDAIHLTRLKRLSEAEGREYEACVEQIFHFDIPRAKLALRRLKYFADITDYYKPIRKQDFSPPVDLNVFRSQMSEMTDWRKSGKLLDAFAGIPGALTFIHGDYDPHPARGITDPLKEKGRAHAFHTLKECGHEPWMEMDTAEAFYQLLETEIRMA
jgi:pimeloyl-ACP methyl ester carboxylesterase